jgi:hypothetical protein
VTKEAKRLARLASRMGEAIHLLSLNGMLADAERRKAEERLLKWSERNGVKLVKVSAITGRRVGE